MEPPAMLVGAFQIDIGNAIVRAVFAVAQHKGVGRAAVEPHVENVEHLIVIIGVMVAAQEPLIGAFSVPGIGPFSLERFKNAGIDRVVTQQVIGVRRLTPTFGKAGQGNTPGLRRPTILKIYLKTCTFVEA